MTHRFRRVIVVLQELQKRMTVKKMKHVLIMTEDNGLFLSLEKILNTRFHVQSLPVSAAPDLILIAAKEHFTELLTARDRVNKEFPHIPVLFLWVETDCIHFLTCGEMQQFEERTIPRSERELLAFLDAQIDGIIDPQKDSQLLTEIQSGIRKNYQDSSANGALQVEYESFASIYQFVEQLASRSGQAVQTLLLTLIPRSHTAPSQETLHNAMTVLSSAIQMTLRRNDVLTGCSSTQMLVLLMDADDDGGHLAANRIFNAFLGLYDDDVFELHYDIKPLGANQE